MPKTSIIIMLNLAVTLLIVNMPAISNIKIDVSGLKKLDNFLSNQKQAHLGIFQAEDARDDKNSNVAIGAKHEFGSFSENIPQRSWLRMPVKVKAKDIAGNAAIAIKNNLTNPKGADIVANSIGAAGLGVIQEAFDTKGFGQWKANRPATVRAKGGKNTPLIDTAEFRQSITFSVAE
jgi:hypothetical protein